jgi:hypothetical protein
MRLLAGIAGAAAMLSGRGAEGLAERVGLVELAFGVDAGGLGATVFGLHAAIVITSNRSGKRRKDMLRSHHFPSRIDWAN